MKMKRQYLYFVVIMLFSAATVAATIPLAAGSDALLDPFFSTRYFQEVTVSPDGKHVAWVQTEVADATRYRRDVYVCSLQAGTVQFLMHV